MDKRDMSLQRKDFMVTLWPAGGEPVCWGLCEPALKEIIKQIKNCNYANGQLEYGCGGKRKHVQLYVQLNKKTRGRTLIKQLKHDYFSHPHVEICMSISASKEYCIKNVCEDCGETTPFCARVEDTEPIFHGSWRKPIERGVKAAKEIKTCAALITEGYDADYIAYHHPNMFLKYGNKIISTIHHRNSYKERKNFLSEEE